MGKKNKTPSEKADPFAAFLAEAVSLKRSAVKTPSATKTKGADELISEWRKLKLAECKPVSVHLHVTHQHCAGCGQDYVSMNNQPLVRKVGVAIEHWELIVDSFIQEYKDLPRIRHETELIIQECIACFFQTEIIEEKK